MSSKRVALYHRGDVDGVCCGSILKKMGFKVYGLDYGEPVPVKLDRVDFIADFSLPLRDMGALREGCVWIDHHRVECEGFRGIRVEVDDGSACLGVYRHFYTSGAGVPAAIKFMSMWDSEGDKTAYTFNLGWLSEWGLRLFDTVELFDDCAHYFRRGSVVKAYLDGLERYRVESEGRPLGRVGMLFSGRVDGFLCDKLPAGRFVAVGVTWDVERSGYRVSMRRASGYDGVDLSVIARKLGGGGHPAAAGCFVKRVEELTPLL